MTKYSTKKALISSIVVLALCISMLVGTTFAWFTDSATSTGNIIKTGTLDVSMQWAEGTEDPASATWTDASAGPIFNNDKWEPGYTEVRHIQIANNGSLALRYKVLITADGKVTDLADVIDVYYVDPAQQIEDRSALTEDMKLGTLTDALSNLGATGNGTLTAGAKDTVTIALVMQESAGNEYMNMSIGTTFTIKVLATQYTYESDSFDDQYDAGAWNYWDGTTQNTDWYTATENEFVLDSGDDLAGFATLVNEGKTFAGKTVKLGADLDLCGATWTPIGITSNKPFSGTFDGQGHTVRNFTLKTSSGNYGAGFFGNLVGNPTVKNVSFDSVSYTTRSNCVGVVAGYIYGSGSFENINVTNANVQSFAKVGGIVGLVADPGAHTINLTNCSVDGTIGGGYNVGGLMGLVLQNVTVNMTNCSTDVDFIMNDSGYDMEYVQNGNGEWMWRYNGQWDYAGVGEYYCYYDAAENEFCMGTPASVSFAVSGPKQLEKAVKAGGNVTLGGNINLAKDIAISNANFVLDGNGYTITGNSTFGLFDITGGSVTVKNVTFDGVNGPIIRTVNGVKFNATDVTVTNGTSTQQQGLFRLLGESTLENCTFKNNTCSMAVTLNYDGANNDPQLVKNCVFENNTCNGTAVLYYVKGASCTLVNNEFIGNTVNCKDNGATVYMGFTENNVITGNLFKNNTVIEANTSTRVSGGIFFGYETEFKNNVFINNKASNANGDALGNDVCVSTYYIDIDLSGNYWGGNAPVEGEDYFVQHKTYGYVVIISDYLTTYGE